MFKKINEIIDADEQQNGACRRLFFKHEISQ
jgi:hypothetical protein